MKMQTCEDENKEAGSCCSESNKLRLGCLEGMRVSTPLSKIFKSIRESFPDVEYYIESHSPDGLIKALEKNDLDAIITNEYFFEPNPGLGSIIFSTERDLLYVSAAHPIFQKEAYNITDLKDETFIIVSPEAFPTKYNYMRMLHKNGFTPRNVKYVPNIESQMFYVEAELGITVSDSLILLYNNPMLRSIELKTSHNINIAWKKSTPNMIVPIFVKLASEMKFPSCY